MAGRHRIYSRCLYGVLRIGYLIGWLTGGLTSSGFAINGLPALVMFVLIMAYFIICHRYLRGTLWRHILRVPRPVAEP
jgi:hypothetical protein